MAADTETFADLRLTARLRSATAIMLAIVPVFWSLLLSVQDKDPIAETTKYVGLVAIDRVHATYATEPARCKTKAGKRCSPS